MPELFEQESLPILDHLWWGEGRSLSAVSAANLGKLLMSMYVELDLDFFGVIVPKVGVFITQEPNKLLNDCHKTKLLGVIGWNLIKMAYRVFVEKIGKESGKF